jgi:ribosomal protein S12 methylthiotransferase
MLSLGCPKNLVDSEVMVAILSQNGFHVVPQPENAEIIIINTCAFILPAKEESIEAVLQLAEWKKTGKGVCTHLVVMGCLPQRYGKSLEIELPEVDLFLGTDEVPHIAKHLMHLTYAKTLKNRSITRKPVFLMNATHPRFLSTPFYSAYLKIAEGCSNLCSYCVIPSIRGKTRSRSINDIMKEAQSLADRGVKEIIITAQDTTAYGKDLKGKPSLGQLLKKLATIEKIAWIRLLYTYPGSLNPPILQAIADEEKICSYLDIPIQHIDDDILTAMKRRGGSKSIKKTIDLARAMIPQVALRTSIIVGFPGESRQKFNKLLAFIRETRFDHLGVFTYSREEGTAAANFPAQVSEETKERRKALLMEEQAAISFQINQNLIGSLQPVLVEGKSDMPEFPFVGRCPRQTPDIDGVTYIKGKNLATGSLITFKITSANEYDIFAEGLNICPQ